MNKAYTFSIEVLVDDVGDLFDHAVSLALKDRLSLDEARALFMTDGEVDIEACLIQIFDPGTSPPGMEIQDSSAEFVGDNE